MPGFKGSWEDGSERKCILQVTPLPLTPVLHTEGAVLYVLSWQELMGLGWMVKLHVSKSF